MIPAPPICLPLSRLFPNPEHRPMTTFQFPPGRPDAPYIFSSFSGAGRALSDLLSEIRDELARARAKFPGANVTTLALVEEVGELAKATFSESRAAVRAEAVQVAVMAIRVALDGDATLDDWREEKGLDPLVEPPEEVPPFVEIAEGAKFAREVNSRVREEIAAIAAREGITPAEAVARAVQGYRKIRYTEDSQ